MMDLMTIIENRILVRCINNSHRRDWTSCIGSIYVFLGKTTKEENNSKPKRRTSWTVHMME